MHFVSHHQEDPINIYVIANGIRFVSTRLFMPITMEMHITHNRLQSKVEKSFKILSSPSE